jgi:16S rRNA C1402 (ribose-2'-O) methylase RsmI
MLFVPPFLLLLPCSLQAIFGLPQLHSLSLSSHYNGITEAEATNLPALPSLQHLSLSNHFSDATLHTLLHSAPSLRSIKLTSCGAVSDAGLVPIRQLCSKLQEVHLELMRGASAAGVAALAAGRCVRRVVVEGCRNVSGQECRQLLQRLSEEKLDLEIMKLR